MNCISTLEPQSNPPTQKIISTAYHNFSVLGLCLILIIGSLIIGLDHSLEIVVVLVESKFRHVTKYARLEWFTNDVLETQRLAHEELGIDATWNGCTGVSAVPVTEKGQMLGVLDIRDPKHPRLQVPEKRTPTATAQEILRRGSEDDLSSAADSGEKYEDGHEIEDTQARQ